MFFLVMPALVAGIHVLMKGVDDRDKAGHDDKNDRVLAPSREIG
ncbi:MAG TPA: hypothetical protein VGU20_09110 [Stellaceae bacterium]|nr:hypothetical protein [Stellaceae bacterium]